MNTSPCFNSSPCLKSVKYIIPLTGAVISAKLSSDWAWSKAAFAWFNWIWAVANASDNSLDGAEETLACCSTTCGVLAAAKALCAAAYSDCASAYCVALTAPIYPSSVYLLRLHLI